MGAGGPPAARARRLRRRRRTRSTSSSAATRTSSSSGRSRRRSSTTASEQIAARSTWSPPPTSCRSSAEDDEIFGDGLARAGRAAGRRGRAAPRPAASATCPRRGDFVAGRIPLRSASADSRRGDRARPRARCSARSRPSAPSPRSTPARSTCTSAAPTRSSELDVERAAGDRLPLRRRLVHAAEEGDRDLHRAGCASSAQALGVELSFGEVSVTEQVIAYPAQASRSTTRVDRHRRPRPAGAGLRHPGALVRAAATGSAAALPPRRPARRPARHRARPDRGAAADRDVRPLGHRRPLDQHPLPDRPPTIFIYDGHPGGVGITRRGYERVRAPGRRRRPPDRASAPATTAAPPACRARSAATSTSPCTRAARSS